MLKINSVEIVNFCNLRCNKCPWYNSPYKRGIMDIDVFKKVLSKMDPEVTPRFNITGFGESFLHPRIIEFIKLSSDHGFKPIINSNGIKLTETLFKNACEAGLSELEISLHTEKSLQVFLRIFRIKKEMGYGIDLCSNVIDWKEKDFDVWRKKYNLDKEILKKTTVMHSHDWANLKDKHSIEKTKEIQSRCAFIQNDECFIKWDGKVYSCCFDCDGVNYIGDIDDFESLKHEPDTYELCKTCSPSWITGEGYGYYRYEWFD